MKKRTLVIGLVAVLLVGGVAAVKLGYLSLDGAERDVKRYTELVGKGATPVTNLDNARTQVGVFSGAVKADEAMVENLKVQLSYCTIRATISGRVSMAAVKVGNFARQADLTPLATIIQAA